MLSFAAIGAVGRLGLDVLCLLALVGWLYRRRGGTSEMTVVFTALNIGLFAAVTSIGSGKFPVGIGFGLFGLLSLVRLRSAAFTLKDVAYTFIALVLALVNGMPEQDVLLSVLLDVVLIGAVWVVDESRAPAPKTRVMQVTLDRAVRNLDDALAEVRRRVEVVPVSVVIEDVDLVRETSRVSVCYAVEDSSWSWFGRDAGERELRAVTSEAGVAD
jgi:hypothetical protein